MQLASFTIDAERYAADIMRIREIILYRKAMPFPKAPDFVEGIINLRGKVVPVIDIRKRLGLTPKEADSNTRIIIVKFTDMNIGMIVDSVDKVLRVGNRGIQPSPKLVRNIDAEYLAGIVMDGDKMVIVLDLQRVLSEAERLRLDDTISSNNI